MSRPYQLTMLVEVFDEELLLKAANEHSAKTCGPGHTVIDDAGDALVMLLDPGGGGDAYAGNCNEAGFQVEETSVEALPHDGEDDE